jgi:hypothetical protein
VRAGQQSTQARRISKCHSVASRAAPQSLSNDEVYAVSGYLLFLNDLLAEDAVVGASTLVALTMPNCDGSIANPRPDVRRPD